MGGRKVEVVKVRISGGFSSPSMACSCRMPVYWWVRIPPSHPTSPNRIGRDVLRSLQVGCVPWDRS